MSNEPTLDVAVVTGASSGIGRAIALALGQLGGTVGLVGRNRNRLAQVKSAIEAQEGSARTYNCDLGDHDQLERLISQLGADFPQLDVLVHSAGRISLGSFDEAPPEVLDRHYSVNTRAPYALTRALLAALKARQGQIVFINSSVYSRTGADDGLYSASKHALKALADSLRQQVASSRMRVVSLYPGKTATPMQREISAEQGREYRPDRMLQPEDVASLLIHTLELPRSAEVTDIFMRPTLPPA